MKVLRGHIILLLCALAITGWQQPVHAQKYNKDLRTRILFLLDASGSMQQNWNDYSQEAKITSAKRILMEIADSLSKEENVEIGLRVYGHQSPPSFRDCKDTQLEVGFSRSSFSYIKTRLQSIRPKGITPIAYSLEKSGGDFPAGPGRNIIILMTDGEESCEGDPCKISRELEAKNIVLKHFVIGIGVSESAKSAFDCIGTFYSVDNQVSLKAVLERIITRVVNETTTQVDLQDNAGRATETDINMSFYHSKNNLLKYDFYHTFNPKGLPDTLSIDPVSEYNLKIHTTPAVRKNNVVLTPDIHNHIQVKSPQGQLEVLLQGKVIESQQIKDKIKCILTSRDEGSIIEVQDINSTQTYLAGNYSLEILTLPRTVIDKLDIDQNKTTKIQIPSPGIANLMKKYEFCGGIFVLKNNRLEKIYELNQDSKIENIALQPGEYWLIYRPRYAKSMHNSKTIEFKINSGESVSLNL